MDTGNIRSAFLPDRDLARVESATFRYAIYSQQRSGSTWLAARLTNLGVFGAPEEYLNPRYAVGMATRLIESAAAGKKIPAKRYLRAVEQVRTTPNGCFGVKIQPNQLVQVTGGKDAVGADILGMFDRIVMLTRRSRLSQAVSGAIALFTDRWRPDGREPDLAKVNLDMLLLDIAAKLARYMTEEEEMARLCKKTGKPVLHLVYEDMFADTDRTLDEVARFLGRPEGIAGLGDTATTLVPEPPPGQVAALVRAAFLRHIEGSPHAARELREALAALKS